MNLGFQSTRIKSHLISIKGFEVNESHFEKQAFTLRNQSQTLTIQAPSPLMYNEWITALDYAIKKGRENFDSKINRFHSFTPLRHSSKVNLSFENRQHQCTVIGITKPPPRESAWNALQHSCISQTKTDYQIKGSKRPFMEGVARALESKTNQLKLLKRKDAQIFPTIQRKIRPKR